MRLKLTFANNITPYVTTNPDGQSIVTTATLSEGNEERPVYVRSIEGDKALFPITDRIGWSR